MNEETPPEPNDELKRCPFCDELIRVKAVICKHCHQWMPGYTYESAIRDLVIQKQVTESRVADEPAALSREEQYEIARNWAKRGRQESLRGFDLSVQDLSGVDLSGADLREAELSEADLSGANLSEANLSGANLFRANLRTANLK
ncbi:MAG: pentapeptide repeat-containing protein, partial [Chloroflexi bacterium]